MSGILDDTLLRRAFMAIRFVNPKFAVIIIVTLISGLISPYALLGWLSVLVVVVLVKVVYQAIRRIVVPRRNILENKIYLSGPVDQLMVNSFSEQYARIDQGKELHLYLETSGEGAANYCMQVCSILQNHPYPVHCHVFWRAHSMGTVIALVCDDVEMGRFATMSPCDPFVDVDDQEDCGRQQECIEPYINAEQVTETLLEIIRVGRKARAPRAQRSRNEMNTIKLLFFNHKKYPRDCRFSRDTLLDVLGDQKVQTAYNPLVTEEKYGTFNLHSSP